GLSPLPIPAGFLSDLEKCPPSAGIALGIDRLLMFLSDSHDIQQVTPA
ncbi:MAG: EF-P lysine aminoacylase GenX, partial [Thermodesulfatator sp.]